VRWEAERSFDGKLCQKYLQRKLLESGNFFEVTIKNVDVFLRYSVYIDYFTPLLPKVGRRHYCKCNFYKL